MSKWQKAHAELMDKRQRSVDYWNKKKKSRDPLKPGDLVLAYNNTAKKTWSTACSWHSACSSQAAIQTPHICRCRFFGTVTVQCAQWLCTQAWLNRVESILEKVLSNTNTTSFLGLSACQLQAVEHVFPTVCCGGKNCFQILCACCVMCPNIWWSSNIYFIS